jgi:hypothetical protein
MLRSYRVCCKDGTPLISKLEVDTHEGPTKSLTQRSNRNSPLVTGTSDV